MPTPSNLSDLHRRTTREHADRVAIRFRRASVLHERSWRQYREDADRVATMLLDRGIAMGDRVAILSANCYEWLVADVAIATLGAVSVPLHASASAEQVDALLRHSEARAAFVQGRENESKLRAASYGVEFVLDFESRDWSACLETAYDPGALELREAGIASDALATIVYTSGTTGDPKGVMLSHGNLLATLQGFVDTIALEGDKRLCAWLPWSHVYGRCVDAYLAIRSGATLYIGESPASILEDLAEARPVWFFAVPRFFEKLYLKVSALPQSERAAALRAVLGGAVERLTCGGAALSRPVAEAFSDAGLPLREGYGLSEATAVVTMQHGDRYRMGSVGYALAGTELRIADDGEIQTRGPHVMQGYWRDEAASSEIIRDGWLSTGDLGALDDDGFLRITGRKKDLIITSTGKNIAPALVEARITEDACIEHAFLYGEGRPYLTALVVPDLEVLRVVAPSVVASLEAAHANREDLCSEDRVLGFFLERVRSQLASASRAEQVRRVLVLTRALNPELHEITSTLKPCRARLLARYAHGFEALYA